MDNNIDLNEKIERRFLLLSLEEKAAVISYGSAIRYSDLRNCRFLALEKIKFYEKKYQLRLSEIEENGLPDDADYEMHEDYIMWHHWQDVAAKAEKQIEKLQPIVEYGVLS